MFELHFGPFLMLIDYRFYRIASINTHNVDWEHDKFPKGQQSSTKLNAKQAVKTFHIVFLI